MGKGGDASSIDTDGLKTKKKTLLIDGIVYDVSSFNHPGGSIIKYLCEEGVDATDAFREFHMRSSKAEKYLKSLPRITEPQNTKLSEQEIARRTKLSKDFVELRLQLEKEGFFAPNTLHAIYRVVEVLALFVTSFYFLSFGVEQQPFLAIAGILLLGVSEGRCGWLMHEAGHYSLSGNIKVDLRLQEFIYGVGCGMSGGWWRNQHNKHHATPQKLKHDVDLDTLPLLAFNKQITTKINPKSLMAKWISLQAYLFAPVSCLLVGLFWTLFLHPRHMLRTKRYFEMACISLRYIGFYGILKSFGYSNPAIVGLYLLTFGFGCMYIFLNFAVSHTHLDVSQPDEYLHWIDYSSKHTTNVSCDSYLCTWWMSYLNFQIEHHLFPSMPQFNHPKISHRVQELFRKNDLVYDQRPYIAAMRDTFRNLHEVGAAAIEPKTKDN